MKDLKQFIDEFKPGKYLIFQEYRDDHGGGTFPVVDIVSFDQDRFDERQEDDIPGRSVYIEGWCESAGYDGIVSLEFWKNGEVWTDGDGYAHNRYRVSDIVPYEYELAFENTGDLSDGRGDPVYYWLEPFVQESWDLEGEGPVVSYRVRVTGVGTITRDRWETRKARGDVDSLVASAKEELQKPKYWGFEREVLVDDEVVWSRSLGD